MVTVLNEVEGLRTMFREMGYHRILKLDDTAGDGARFDDDVGAFSRVFGLQVERRECHSTVFEHSYEMAKERMVVRADGLPARGLVAELGLARAEAGPPGGGMGRSR